MRSNLLLWLFLCTVALAFGFFAGRFFAVPYFRLDPMINIMDLFSILATIGAALILAVVVDKQKQDGRVMKDLFINRASKIDSILEQLEDATSSGSFQLQVVVANHKRLNVKFRELCLQLNSQGILVPKSLGTLMQDELKTLKNLLTNSPTTGTPNPSIVVTQGVVTLNSTRLDQAKTSLSNVGDHLFTLQLHINRS